MAHCKNFRPHQPGLNRWNRGGPFRGKMIAASLHNTICWQKGDAALLLATMVGPNRCDPPTYLTIYFFWPSTTDFKRSYCESFAPHLPRLNRCNKCGPFYKKILHTSIEGTKLQHPTYNIVNRCGPFQELRSHISEQKSPLGDQRDVGHLQMIAILGGPQ